MNCLKQINYFLEKWIFIVLPLLMGMGIAVGSYVGVLSSLTAYFFMIITFISSFSADWRKFIEILKRPLLFIFLTILLHLAIPFLTLKLAGFFLGNEPDLVIGITLAMMLPIGVTSIFWVVFVGGNVTTALSIVTLNTLISPFILPASFAFLMDTIIEIDIVSLMLSLLKLVLIPSILGMFVGEWLRKYGPQQHFYIVASVISKTCLYIVVFSNAAALSNQIALISENLIQLLFAMASFIILGYLLSYGVGFLFFNTADNRTSITFTGGIRNYTVGLVLATNFLPPLAAFPILVAMLLQHPVAMIIGRLFKTKIANK